MLRRLMKSAAHWVRVVAVGAVALVAFQTPACGGRVLDTSGERDGGGAQGGYGPIGSGDLPPVGGGARPSKPSCGNGRMDPGEVCDGADLGGATCSTGTMGTRPLGTMSCSSACTLDVSACRTNGGMGGVTGVGGFRASGGFYGAGGFGSVDACYTSGGVPVASGGCAYGSVATDQCLSRTTQPNGNCSQGCGCKACPSAYTRCLVDGGCEFIFACAESAGCSNLADCYKLGCSTIIDRAGGFNSTGARYAEAAFSCLSQNGCSLACLAF
jgi:hypothetical protein